MSQIITGVDFGLSVTDALLLSGVNVQAHVSLHRPGPADEVLLRRVLSKLHAGTTFASPGTGTAVIGVAGGRSGQLPEAFERMRIVHVREPDAIGRGGLELAGAQRALVVSCGTGTAMIAADAATGQFVHLSGTAVGGGTLEGLAAHLLGIRDASAVADLAQRGDAAGVDTTLGEVLGGGVGNLPSDATAVNLGRLADLDAPEPADLAAGLITMVAQTIALIALNAARAAALPEVVFVGRLAEFGAVRDVLESVFTLYGADAPHFPAGAAHATALGAALAARAVLEPESPGT